MRRLDLGLLCDWIVLHEKDGPVTARGYFLGIENQKIAVLEKLQKSDLQEAQRDLQARFDCREWRVLSNRAVVPGLINAHTHTAMTLLRGVADDLAFETWIFKKILPLERALVSAQFVRTGAELAAMEFIRFGVTAVADMYFFAPEMARVWDRVGLRGVVGSCFTDFPAPGNLSGDRKEWERQWDELWEGFGKHPLVRPSLAPHAPYSCSEETLAATVRLREKYGVPLQIHVSETAGEVQESRQKHEMTPVARLQRLGCVGRGVMYAHCVHVDDGDIEILAKTKTSVIHNPESNLKLGAGIAPVPELLRAGVNVGIGSDGSASNNNLSLFHEMDTAAKLQKIRIADQTSFGAREVLQMATLGGATAIGLEQEIGSLSVGKSADLFVIDLGYPHLQPIYDLISHIVYSMTGLEVETVWCAGKKLFDKGSYISIDKEAVFSSVASFQKKVLAQTVS